MSQIYGWPWWSPTIYMQVIPNILPIRIGYVKLHEPQAWNNCNIPAHPALPIYHRLDCC
jgi:hypothetical protein